MNPTHVFLFLILIGFLSCSEQKSIKTKNSLFVKTDGIDLIDSTGQTLNLRGLNHMNKNRDKHFEGLDQNSFDSIRSWNMNAVRFGIFWDGIEPEPGKIDTLYLQKIDTAITKAKNAGLYVLLDMHQDLYSEKYGGDGAPDWACLDEDKPNIASDGTWDDAYFTSPAIQTAFDNFWANKKASDGIGVQDHLIKVWKTVAERYADNPTVLGYNLMNEPLIGSPINDVLDAYFGVLLETEEASEFLVDLNEEEIIGFWLSKEGRSTIMNLLQDASLYKNVMDASEPIYKAFEKNHLQPFYDKAYAEIKKVDPHHLMFLEPSVSANIGVKSYLSNNFDDKLVYAPHTYDIVTDTDDQSSFSVDRLALIIDRHRQKRDELNVPLVMGEWGAFYHADSSVIKQADYILNQFDNIQSGQFYWSYEPDLNQRTYFKTLTERK